jgi:pantoate--beta-alanine ligase
VRTVSTIAEARDAVREARRGGARVGLVPTMGFLHEGHLRLVDRARAESEFVVMSVFVNPLQFAPTDDLARYPRDPAGDATKASGRGVDLMFAPDPAEMYPGARVARVEAAALGDRWEGEVRPGHFSGVLTVVSKLFNIVQPDVAVFGQKDFQQAALVRALVRDLDFPLRVIVAPTTRERDGLAMSSRNTYLAPDERTRALALSRALRAACAAFAGGERDAGRVRAAALAEIGDGVAVDYFGLADPDTLEPVDACVAETVAMVAARVGRTRLIDNAILGRGVDA